MFTPISREDLEVGKTYFDGPYEHSIALQLLEKSQKWIYLKYISGGNIYGNYEGDRIPFNSKGNPFYLKD